MTEKIRYRYGDQQEVRDLKCATDGHALPCQKPAITHWELNNCACFPRAMARKGAKP